MSDLAVRIGQLSDEGAIEALALVTRWQNSDLSDVKIVAKEEERRFRNALGEPEARRYFESRALIQPVLGDSSDLSSAGDLARSALICLVEQGGTLKETVAHAIDRPAPVGMRDPLTLGIIGLVVLALRPVIDIKRDPETGWSFHFKTEPLKDSTMAKVIGKLLSAVSPNAPDR